MMRAGAHDYLIKDKLARLGPAIERERHDAADRAQRVRAEATLHYQAYHDLLTGLLPRFGPRILIPAGMLVAAAGLVILAGQLGVNTSYPSIILPALVVIGLGLGLVFACAINTATYGAAPEDAGVASAMVNTNQQVGGSIGTALLNTIAASALASYVLAHGRGPLVLAQAAVHSYVVAFWVSAAILAGSAVVCALVLPSGTAAPAAGPVAVPAAVTREEMTVRDA